MFHVVPVPFECRDFSDATFTLEDKSHRKCYYYFEGTMTYSHAKSICESRGAHVVTFENDAEEIYVTKQMQRKLNIVYPLQRSYCLAVLLSVPHTE